MTDVHSFVYSFGVMKKGEKLDDLDLCAAKLCQAQTVFQDPGSMGYSVNAVPRQSVLLKNSLDELFGNHNF